MATKKPVEVIADGNIKNLAMLKAEFVRGIMIPRKLVVLKNRLIELYHSKEITISEQDLMELILRRERGQGKIEEIYEEQLNVIEQSRCEDLCRVKTADAPRVHYLTLDQVCKFEHDADTNRYYIYVDIVVPPEWQMSRETVLKENRGHPTTADDYKPARIRVKRLNLTPKEFNAWFDIESDLLNVQAQEEQAFQF